MLIVKLMLIAQLDLIVMAQTMLGAFQQQ